MNVFFLGPKSRFLAEKPDFCHTTPILVNGPFVALGEAVHFPPWERFSDFPFRSYSFRKEKILPPPHCGGAGWIKNYQKDKYRIRTAYFFLLSLGSHCQSIRNTAEGPDIMCNMHAYKALQITFSIFQIKPIFELW